MTAGRACRGRYHSRISRVRALSSGDNLDIMRMPVRRLIVLLGLAAPLAVAPGCGPAWAQVTVDLHALDAPSGGSGKPPEAAPAPAPRKPVPHAVPQRRAVAKPAPKPTEEGEKTPPKPETKPPPAVAGAPPPPAKPIPSGAQPPTPGGSPAPPAAVVGLTPPPAAVIPPPAPDSAPMAPTPPPTISATAGTTLAALPQKEGQGVRLAFAPGDADLTQQTADAVKALVAAAPKSDLTTYNVMAYATGVPQDPSAARRLSLSRALQVRSALMAYGVPSTHIYVRAMGAQAGAQGGPQGAPQGGEGPGDRVDVLVMGASASVPPPPSPTAASAKSESPPADSQTRTP